jgi:hypothetical protein
VLRPLCRSSGISFSEESPGIDYFPSGQMVQWEEEFYRWEKYVVNVCGNSICGEYDDFEFGNATRV